MKFKFLLFTLLFGGLLMTDGCGDDSFSCEDGKQNQGETGIDCGGPCPNCAYMRTCSDGIQNGEALGVDCGGPCPNACVSQPPVLNPFFNATIDGTAWSATSVSSTELNGRVTFSGSNDELSVVISYSEDFTTRTGDFDLSTNTAVMTGTGIDGECIAQSGSVTFTKFDTTNKVVSGTFEFTCQGTDAVDVMVTNGEFEDIGY